MGDFPDWGGFYNNGAFFPSFDLAELAARLGSPITYDRRGAFCWGDIFDGGLQRWTLGGSPAGYSITLDPDTFEYGRFSAKLTSAVQDNATVGITREINLPLADTIGLSCMYRLSIQDTLIKHYAQVYNEGRHLYVRLEVDCKPPYQIRILTPSGLQTLANPTYAPVATEQFCLVKMVFDYVNEKWVRVIVGNNEYDASDYSLWYAGGATLEYVSFSPGFEAGTALGTGGYIDNVIYTAVEPL